MLITRPNHDVTTNYLYWWSKTIIEYAISKGTRVVDLKGDKVTKKKYIDKKKKIQPSFLMLNGHGNSDSICGQNNEILVSVNMNMDLLGKRVVFSRSCSSAKNLGKQCTKNGGSFIGYDDDFVFMIDESKTTRPLEDTTASLFLEPSNQVAISLIKGHTVKEAHRRSGNLFKKNISQLLTSEGSEENKDALPYLLWDLNHQVCLGNENLQAFY